MSVPAKSNSTEEQLFAPKEFFNEQWQIYDKVLKNNYMRHRDIYHILHELLVSYFQKPFKMLELGCGDAGFSTQALLNTNIASYMGIDLSTPALSIAKQNMAIIECEKTFTEGDFFELVPVLEQNQNHKFDLVLISFALHHLQREQKDFLINQIKNILNPSGLFILIDLVPKQQEDRDSYIKRYLSGVKKDWTLLTEREYSIVSAHISSSDFPESQQTLQLISDKCGFARLESLYCDPQDTTQLLCFYSGQ
ncbi:class I SAM-dependent methyltransferase [Aetokthonos hydrillicola Thurmond2011]|jgi:ubiquinone/menaquinone biosynthesis C-methylase UbiE|uniref:Class I SAM-dependent methyltransferase n=1 Tax=Aetokthonos hydrillicola Thurmond2011 TaxID=2712845 RepID=A0AAP5ICY9_9CYAN|nr:class I SAM-dependent methyltransferase [Aetokthonos hydrillicola]MBO3462641.1 class I SAM-dependent methyltransferase [Aetokthonos hydrillicola CCALA 1050]MBW4585773.1 class I SAM-dependent methyltransferase [Aetokthonos hydrillicola CCALA 1050]MDR9899276.1 class I SAM-dependent methyltransferase [Aetokthonos hydrillicola Thurmond2011]